MMNDMQLSAIAAIEAQQPTERTDVWMVGEQLKDICRAEPDAAALLAEDLQNESMGLSFAAKKMKEFADTKKTGNFACVTPAESDKVLRDFYGLPAAGTKAEQKQEQGKIIDLADFL